MQGKSDASAGMKSVGKFTSRRSQGLDCCARYRKESYNRKERKNETKSEVLERAHRRGAECPTTWGRLATNRCDR